MALYKKNLVKKKKKNCQKSVVGENFTFVVDAGDVTVLTVYQAAKGFIEDLKQMNAFWKTESNSKDCSDAAPWKSLLGKQQGIPAGYPTQGKGFISQAAISVQDLGQSPFCPCLLMFVCACS